MRGGALKEPRQFFAWAFVAAMLALLAVLAAMQYNWIAQLSRVEKERITRSLHAGLEQLQADFDGELGNALRSLVPPDLGTNYVRLFEQWQDHAIDPHLFSRIVVVTPANPPPTTKLLQLDQHKGTLRSIDWPPEWSELQQGVVARLDPWPRAPRGPMMQNSIQVIERPVFEGGPEERGQGRPREQGWVILELDLQHLRENRIPDLLGRYLRSDGSLEYDVTIRSRFDPSVIVYQSGAAVTAANADASISLLNPEPRRRHEERPPPRGGGRWNLLVRHRAGSLEAAVAQARQRNTLATTGVFLLLLLTIGALVRFTRRAQQLSQLQMEFVAGVSHELRTPLTVIRTAAHNLNHGVLQDQNAAQLQRYADIIAKQSQNLTAIVDQVLDFSGKPASRREPVDIRALIDDSVGAASGCELDRDIAPNLPAVQGDAVALRCAIENLLANAAKHGGSASWIGLSAAVRDGSVEIRVADKGPGIPAHDRRRIFDPFYRGKAAIDNQIHGTGLGLSLVKRTAEAHGGSVATIAEPGYGAVFVMRLPIPT